MHRVFISMKVQQPIQIADFYKDYGFKVDFKLENDLLNAMNAWIAGEYDIISTNCRCLSICIPRLKTLINTAQRHLCR